MHFSLILQSLTKFEPGEVSQTCTPRTLVFYKRHILDVLVDENTCVSGIQYPDFKLVISPVFRQYPISSFRGSMQRPCNIKPIKAVSSLYTQKVYTHISFS